MTVERILRVIDMAQLELSRRLEAIDHEVDKDDPDWEFIDQMNWEIDQWLLDQMHELFAIRASMLDAERKEDDERAG